MHKPHFKLFLALLLVAVPLVGSTGDCRSFCEDFQICWTATDPLDPPGDPNNCYNKCDSQACNACEDWHNLYDQCWKDPDAGRTINCLQVTNGDATNCSIQEDYRNCLLACPTSGGGICPNGTDDC